MSIEHVGNQVWARAKPGGYEQLRILEVSWIFWAGLFSSQCHGASRRWGEDPTSSIARVSLILRNDLPTPLSTFAGRIICRDFFH